MGKYTRVETLPALYDYVCAVPMAEVFDNIVKLKNNKASGEDGITVENFESNPNMFTQWLRWVINEVCKTEIPDWSDAAL